MVVTVERGKNDQEGRGSQRTVPERPHDGDLCLYKAMRMYETVRDSKQELLFYNTQSRALGKRLASTTPTHALRSNLQAGGMSKEEAQKYASNSLRKGGTTRAFAAGVDRLVIKRHGNWKSDAVDAYITISTEEEAAMVDAIMNDSEEELDEDGEEEEHETAARSAASASAKKTKTKKK